MIKTLIRFAIDPFNLFWLLLLVGLGCWFFRRIRLAKGLAISAGVWFLLISTPLVPNMVLNSLEGRYQPLLPDELSNREAPYHIVVLGGGHGIDPNLPANSLLSINALGRLNEGIRLHRQLPNSTLVLSGHSIHDVTQAEMLQRVALLLGVEKDSILLQKEPGTTYSEARTYAENHGNSRPVILVTGASHMPRAMMTFKFFGIDPIPSPTNYRLKGSWKHRWIGFPSTRSIKNLSIGLEEYVGIVWYRYGVRRLAGKDG